MDHKTVIFFQLDGNQRKSSGTDMKKIIWLSFGIMWLCISCSAGNFSQTGSSPMLQDEIMVPETYEETMDAACSYFYFLWGKSAELEGKYDEAIEAYQKALICDSKAYHIMRGLAVLYLRRGQNEQAAELIQKVIEADPTDLQARSLLANLYNAMGRKDEAANVYLEILHDNPDNLNVMLFLGSLYAGNRQFEKAQDVFEKIVEQEPESYAAHYYLAKIYSELHLYDKSFAAYEKALSLNWSAMLAFEVAEAYENQEKHDKAIELYRRILEEDETNEQARALLVTVYWRQGEYDMALKELKELRSYAKDVQKVDFFIGRLLLDQKRFDEAIAFFSRILEENPHLESARYMLITAYYQKGDLESAKKILRQIEPDNERYQDAILMLARILHEQNNIDGAVEALKNGIADSTGKVIDLYIALALMYYEQDQAEKGLLVYQEALKKYPDEPNLLFEYGLYLDRMGDTEGALVEMQKVLEFDPQNPYALNYVGYTWAEKNLNLEKSLEYIKQAVSLKPEDGFIRDSLGWVYYKLGEYEQAVAELEKALELAAEDPTIYEHMGDAYLMVGMEKKALNAYEKSYELFQEEDKKENVRRKIEALQRK